MTLHSFRWPLAAARASLWLLLIGLVAFNDAASNMDLAPSRTAVPFPKLRSDIELQILSHNLFVDREWLRSGSDFSERLRRLRHDNPDSRVSIIAKYGATFGDVREAVTVARDAGVAKLTLVTRRTRLLVPHAWRVDRTRLVRAPDDQRAFRFDEPAWF